MEAMDVSLFAVLSAGALSFASPDVLPLVLAYLGHFGRVALTTDEQSIAYRWSTFLQALGFVLGLSIVFTALCASAGMIGHPFCTLRPVFQRIGGVILVADGLGTMELWRALFRHRGWRFRVRSIPWWGMASSFLVGAIFAAAWRPCKWPVLSDILTLAGASDSVGRGTFLLFIYCLGLGTLFLLLGLSLGWAAPLLRRLNRYGRVASVLCGTLLIATGVVFFTHTLSRLTGYLTGHISPLLGE